MNCIFTINNKEILSLVNENNIKNAGKNYLISLRNLLLLLMVIRVLSLLLMMLLLLMDLKFK